MCLANWMLTRPTGIHEMRDLAKGGEEGQLRNSDGLISKGGANTLLMKRMKLLWEWPQDPVTGGVPAEITEITRPHLII
jgi:hypothetical protein